MFGSVKFGFGLLSGKPCSGRVRFGLGEVRVRVTYKYHVRVDTGFGSGEVQVGSVSGCLQ